MFNKKIYNMKTKEKTFTEFTPIGKTYWSDEGIYQKEYKALYECYVPDSGDAPTIHGELLRAVSRLHYDYFNNGNCNVQDYDWDDSDIFIKPYYKRMIDFIKEYSNAQNEINKLVFFLTDFYHYGRHNLFNENNQQIYTRLVDKIMQQILTEGKNGNKPNPKFREDA